MDIQKEIFLFNLALQQAQQSVEIDKYQTLMAQDAELVDLRARIKDIAKNQLENGVINANEYLQQVNAEDQARLALAMHQLQQRLAAYNTRISSGN